MRQIISGKKAEYSLEFFIFGLVFIALFILLLILDAGIILGFLTGLLAGFCLITAWYSWRWRLLWKPGTVLTQEIDVARSPERAYIATTIPAAGQETEEEIAPQPLTTIQKTEVQATASPISRAEKGVSSQSQEQIVSAPITIPTILSFSEKTVLSAKVNMTDAAATLGLTEEEAAPIDATEETIAPNKEVLVEPVVTSDIVLSPEQTAMTQVLAEHLLTQENIDRANQASDATHLIDTKSLSLDAYCVKCKTKRTMQHPHLTTLKNGHPAMKGSCPVCGSGLFRIVTRDAHWHTYEEPTS